MRSFIGTTGFGIAIVLTGAALFGTLGPVSRFAYEAGMAPLAFIAWRAFIGAVGTGVFSAWRISRGGARLTRLGALTPRARLALVIAALAGSTLNLAMFIAFERLTVGLVLLCFYTYPAMVAIVGVALGREHIDRSRGSALLLALGGMALVMGAQLDPTTGIRLDLLGIGLALSTAVSQTVFIFVARGGFPTVPTDQAMTIVLATSAAVTVTLAIGTGVAATLLQPLSSPEVLPLLLFAGVFAAAIASLCFLGGIRLIGGLRTGILSLFEPVVGVALAALLLGEALGALEALGGAAVLVAALILQRASSAEIPELPTTPDVPLDEPVPIEEEVFSLHVPGGP